MALISNNFLDCTLGSGLAWMLNHISRPVAAICGATTGLARGALLDVRRHTSNSREYLAATNYRGAERYEDALAVTDKDLITAPGTAPVDFAYHIFKRLDIYAVPLLEAWYGLFKTGNAEYFSAFIKAANESQNNLDDSR